MTKTTIAMGILSVLSNNDTRHTQTGIANVTPRRIKRCPLFAGASIID